MTSAVIICRGSHSEGWGHVMRGLTIRDFLNYKSIDHQLYLELDDQLAEALNNIDEGPVTRLKLGALAAPNQPVNLCFLDRYIYDPATIEHYQAISDHLIVFDELSKIDFVEVFRPEDTLVRAQLLGKSTEAKGAICDVLRGAPYFVIKRPYPDTLSGSTAKPIDILVMLGGGAGHEKVYEDLAARIARAPKLRELTTTFVLGANASVDLVECIRTELPNATIERYVADPIALMRQSKVGIMSGGYSKYEAAYAGLPSVLLAVQDHQIEIAQQFCDAGGGVYAGHYAQSETIENVIHQVGSLSSDVDLHQRLSQRASTLIDGKALDRILARSLRVSSS